MGIGVEEITVAEVFQVKGGRSPVSKKRLVLNDGKRAIILRDAIT